MFSSLQIRSLTQLMVLGGAIVSFSCSDGMAAPIEDIRESGRDLFEQTQEWVSGDSLAQRRQKCDEEQGTWVERLIVSECTAGEASVESEIGRWQVKCGQQDGMTAEYQCLHEDGQGGVYFNDGPSVPPEMQKLSGLIDDQIDQGRYNGLFWAAGVSHDLCYHHNPATEQLSKADCDKRFLSDLAAVCAHKPNHQLPWFRQDVCKNMAAGMYMAVDQFGQPSFDAVNLVAKLPAYVPLTEVYGIEGDPVDDEIKERIDQADSWSP